MIDNNLISSQTVIAKIIADLDLKEDNMRITDIREWIMEAILKIGAVQQYEHKVEIVKIHDYQAKLPCDLYKLNQVAYSLSDCNGWLPMRKSTSSFGLSKDKVCKPKMFIQDVILLPLVKNMFNLVTDQEALEKLNEEPNIRKTLSTLVNLHTVPTVNGKYPLGSINHNGTNYSYDLQYTVKPGYINTNMCDGYLKISYYAIYTDEDGLPMIPDLESYKECIYWYVTMKLMYPKRLKGQIDTRTFYDIQNSYNFYRKQAYAEAMMPTIDDMESIKNNWNKLYPQINEHDTFFSTIGEEQILYNQNRL